MTSVSFNSVQPTASVTAPDATQPALAKEVAEHIVRLSEQERSTADLLAKVLSPDGMTAASLTELLAGRTQLDVYADALSSWLHANANNLKQLSRNLQAN